MKMKKKCFFRHLKTIFSENFWTAPAPLKKWCPSLLSPHIENLFIGIHNFIHPNFDKKKYCPSSPTQTWTLKIPISNLHSDIIVIIFSVLLDLTLRMYTSSQPVIIITGVISHHFQRKKNEKKKKLNIGRAKRVFTIFF